MEGALNARPRPRVKVFERKRTAMGRARDREKDDEARSFDSEILSRLRVPVSVRQSDISRKPEQPRMRRCDARNSCRRPVVLENQSYHVSTEVSTPFSLSRVLVDSRSRLVVPSTELSATTSRSTANKRNRQISGD